MPKLTFAPDNTQQIIIPIFIQDSSKADGSGLTGLVYNTAGLKCYYLRRGNAKASLTLANMLNEFTWASAGFVEVDATNMPGVYAFGIPTSMVTSVGSTALMFSGAANMAPALAEFQVGTDITSVANESLTSMLEVTADPGKNPSIREAIQLLYMALRNLRLTTATTDKIHRDDGTLVATATLSDDGTTFTKSKIS